MKRRKFLRQIGLGTTVLTGFPQAFTGKGSHYIYPAASVYDDLVNWEGSIMLRLEMTPVVPEGNGSTDILVSINHGFISDIRCYMCRAGASSPPKKGGGWKLKTDKAGRTFFLILLKETSPDSEINIHLDKNKFRIFFREIFGSSETIIETKSWNITMNFLQDHEIGNINLDTLGIPDPGHEFSFCIFADPQGGDPSDEGNVPTRMKIHNAFAEDCIERANEMEPPPAFGIVLGDVVDSQGQASNFEQMAGYFKKLRMPLLYALGNHETRYNSVFTPGYNMNAFSNFLEAQKKLNGLELLLYSFDAGSWHFIIWPDPLRKNFWETHPHYFYWLEKDLEKNRNRPVFFLQHVPIHPIGIDPMISYTESVLFKRTLVNILAAHGNIKYLLSGHVHIPVKASFKTAIEYRGMKMINLPPAGYRPRAFGEEDFFGGPSQGLLKVTIRDQAAILDFCTVSGEQFSYPNELPVILDDHYPLWLKEKWELPVFDRVRNGNFSEGLTHWNRPLVYTEDKDVSNICESRNLPGMEGSGLYLYSKKRGYDAPGQDRLPQTINHLAQSVRLKQDSVPILKLKYYCDPAASDVTGWCGAWIWLEGYQGSLKKFNLVYAAGMLNVNPGGFEVDKDCPVGAMELPCRPGTWMEANLKITDDYSLCCNRKCTWDELQADRMIINLGVWTANDGPDQPFAIYFTDLQLEEGENVKSQTTDRPIGKMPDEKIWWLGKFEKFIHIAGEHRYLTATKFTKT